MYTWRVTIIYGCPMTFTSFRIGAYAIWFERAPNHTVAFFSDLYTRTLITTGTDLAFLLQMQRL
jgi:hypothetical protein